MQYLIWWLAQEDYEEIGDELPKGMPEYIRTEYRSRYGRNGRGRLWVANHIPVKEIDWDDRKPAARLAGKRGGIVIDWQDTHHVFRLPGFLTDLELNFINWQPLDDPTRPA